MESLEKDFWKEDYKFFRNALLWIKIHPERNIKFNKQLKPIRREIFDNLKLNISQDNWKCISFDVFKSYFWAYFEKNKNVNVFDTFENIDVKLNDDNKINLANYLKILNLIKSKINLAIEDIQQHKRIFVVSNGEQTYSQLEDYFLTDNQMKEYNDYLYKKFSKYNANFKKGLFEFDNIIYCYVLKNKFKNSDFFNFSGSESIIFEDWISINLGILYQIIEMLKIKENISIAKKI